MTMHRHEYQGQTLEHSHPGSDRSLHGYFEHLEDGAGSPIRSEKGGTTMTAKRTLPAPAPSKYAQTYAGLSWARADYDALRAAHAGLARAGETALAGKVIVKVEALARLVITIPIRCLVCKLADVPVEFTVGDPQRAEPNAAVCGPCASGRAARTYCTAGHQPGEHDGSCLPPADPANRELRLVRAIFGRCPDCDRTEAHEHDTPGEVTG